MVILLKPNVGLILPMLLLSITTVDALPFTDRKKDRQEEWE